MKKHILAMSSVVIVFLLVLTGCTSDVSTSSSTGSYSPGDSSNQEKESNQNQSGEKVVCSMCNGTGQVKYYYGDSAWDAAINGYNDYEYGPCTSCDGTGYIYVKTHSDNSTSTNSTSGSSKESDKKTCPSCGKKVDKLVTKKDAAGESRTWCSQCWKDYDAIMGR